MQRDLPQGGAASSARQTGPTRARPRRLVRPRIVVDEPSPCSCPMLVTARRPASEGMIEAYQASPTNIVSVYEVPMSDSINTAYRGGGRPPEAADARRLDGGRSRRRVTSPSTSRSRALFSSPRSSVLGARDMARAAIPSSRRHGQDFRNRQYFLGLSLRRSRPRYQDELGSHRQRRLCARQEISAGAARRIEGCLGSRPASSPAFIERSAPKDGRRSDDGPVSTRRRRRRVRLAGLAREIDGSRTAVPPRAGCAHTRSLNTPASVPRDRCPRHSAGRARSRFPSCARKLALIDDTAELPLGLDAGRAS